MKSFASFNSKISSVFFFFFGLQVLLTAQTSDTNFTTKELETKKGEEKIQLLIKLSELQLDKDANESLEYAKQAFQTSKDKKLKLEALNQMVYAFEKLKKYDSVDAYADEAVQLGIQVKDSINLPKYLTSRGWMYYYKGEYNKAITDFSQSYFLMQQLSKSSTLKSKLDLSKFATLTNNLGTVFTKTGQYDSAIIYILKSLEYKEKYQVTDTKKAVSYINLCSLCFYKEDYRQAASFAEKGLELAEKSNDSLNMSRLYLNLGVCQKFLGDTISAIQYYLQSEKLSSQINNTLTQSSALTNLGILYGNQKNWGKAKKYLQASLKLNETLKNKSKAANIYTNLANYFYETQQFDSTILFVNKSLELSQSIGEIRISEQNHLLKSKASASLQQYTQAYLSLKDYIQVHDSIYNVESNERYDDLLTKYETEKTEKENIALKYENELQVSAKRKLIWTLITFSLLFILILFSIQLKRKKDKEIHRQQELLFAKEKALSDAKIEKSKLKEEELQKEILYKSKQLTTHALNMMQKNTLLQELQSELDLLSKKIPTNEKTGLSRIKALIKRNLKSESDWDLFKLYFEDVNNQFYQELDKLNPELNASDLRLCALLKLNLNIKEAAAVMNIEAASVKTARYKLRKKLGLAPETDLQDFIRKIG